MWIDLFRCWLVRILRFLVGCFGSMFVGFDFGSGGIGWVFWSCKVFIKDGECIVENNESLFGIVVEGGEIWSGGLFFRCLFWVLWRG